MPALIFQNHSVNIHPVAGGFAVLVLGLILRAAIRSFSRSRRARQLGCKPVPMRTDRWLTGIDGVIRLSAADKVFRVPEKLKEMIEQQNADTYRDALFGEMNFVTSNPKNIQAMLATQFHDFELGDLRRMAFSPMLGGGIFTADGKYWEHSRTLLRPQFVRDQVADLDLEETHVQHFMAHLKPSSPGAWTEVVDLGPLFFRLTIDSATEFLFGESVASQLLALRGVGGDDNEKTPPPCVVGSANIAKSFDDGMAVLGFRVRFAQFSWLYNPKKFQNDCKLVHQFADTLVHRALEQYRNGGSHGEDQKGKERYVFLHELVKATQDPIELRCQLLHILLAGRDTTAGLMGWACYCLARHPDVYRKLRAIILDTFGTYDNPRNITFHTLKSCSYLQYTLNETLRLFPSVPINSRQATRNTTLPFGGGPDGQSPFFVPKGVGVCYTVFAMHRRKDLWGEDADEFKPDRWIGRKPGWEYLPFNGGPRICLGQQFALTEAGYVLTRFMQRFEAILDADEPDIPVQHQYSVTSAPRRVLVKLKEKSI